jgi:glycosyltransferase involved in cell wall biosynthesis
VPHIVFSWENLDRVPNRTVQRLLERATLNGIDGIIAGSDAAADRLRARGYDGPTAVAPETGVNTEAFSPRNHNAELRDRFGIDDGPVVLYTGRLVPEKGLATLLDSVTAVADIIPDVQYLIVGEGEMAADLRERIRRSNLGDRVTLVTERQPYELMPAIYSLAAVFTYPSYTIEGWAEQFGYSVVEAMSCGVPVVTTECGSLPWVVGDTGDICPEQDSDALVSTLVDLLSDDDRRERLSKAARKRAREEFSIPHVAKKHESMLEKVLYDD